MIIRIPIVPFHRNRSNSNNRGLHTVDSAAVEINISVNQIRSTHYPRIPRLTLAMPMGEAVSVVGAMVVIGVEEIKNNHPGRKGSKK